ncbi:MAG: hypothetical protein MUO85_10880, partial [candidate division Zixibacteria bacterium]|nr:hypothetical protein [candidate division Zixibacteria bacterium]
IGLGTFAMLEIIKFFALAGIFLLALQMFAQAGSFIKVLALTSHIGLIAIPEMLIKTPLILIKKSLAVYTSLAAILPVDMQGGMLFRFLNNLDIFVIWKVILFSMGLAIVTQIPIKKSSWMVIYLWITWIILSTLLGGLVRIY